MMQRLGLAHATARRARDLSISCSSKRLPIHQTRFQRRAFTTIGPGNQVYNRRRNIVSAVVGVAVSSLWLAYSSRSTLAEAPPEVEEDKKQGRIIRLDEVHQHNRSADTYWVYRGDRVYDITDWVPNHPGGEVILRAVGGSIEQYWNIFSIHQKQDVYDILEQYFIGTLDPRDLVDGKPATEHIDDPFVSDPSRDPALIVHSPKPCNAETPQSELGGFITPNRTFYVRNHLWVPKVDDPGIYRLTIELPDGEEVSYSLMELREKFSQHTITATLQCSGNRRVHMTEGSRPTNGLQWNVGAISNAEWTGVRLRDILTDAGFDIASIPADVKHAQFTGAEAYGASIPIAKACDQYGDVLLAHTMNGKDIPRDHGYPLRVLVPGTVAARSVKWVNKISLSEEESTSQWQRRDYKCFGPNEGDKPDWDAAPAIQETPIQSAITSVHRVTADRLKNSKLAQVYGLEEESVILTGYAFSGGGREIVRVDVSPDDGKTWQQAHLLPDDNRGSKAWSWRRWESAIPVRKLRGNYCVKAVDDGYNTQPESFEPYYNFRGNLANAWHRVPVQHQSNFERHSTTSE